MHNIVVVAIEMEIVQSELLKLKWCDVDLEQGVLKFQSKVDGSQRTVQLSPRAAYAMRETAQLGSENMVFPITHKAIRQALAEAVKRARAILMEHSKKSEALNVYTAETVRL